MARIAMVCQDVGPTKSMLVIAEELAGHSVSKLLGNGSPDLLSFDEIEKNVKQADVVFLGMSSAPNSAEIELHAALCAQKYSKTYGFFGDIEGCHKRQWFSEVFKHATFYCAIDETEARAAKQLFPDVDCVVSGNPARDEMFFPKFAREKIRKVLGIGKSDFAVLIPGRKTVVENMTLLVPTIEALTRLQVTGQKVQLFFSAHPGDHQTHVFAEDLSKLSVIPVTIVEKNHALSTSEMLPGFDLVLEFLSSVGVEAACLDIRIVTLTSSLLKARASTLGISGETEVVRKKVSTEVDVINSKELPEIFNLLRFTSPLSNMFIEQRQNCARAYPRPNYKSESAEKIAQVLLAYK